MNKKNHEGYDDPTAYQALQPLVAYECKQQRKIRRMMKLIKAIAEDEGFEVVGRITFKDKKGRLWK